MNNDADSSPFAARMITVIALALFLWASVIAWGVVRNQPQLDIRKPLVILGVVVVFLSAWGFLLRLRRDQ